MHLLIRNQGPTSEPLVRMFALGRTQHLPLCNDGSPRRLILAECRTCNARRSHRGGGYLLCIRCRRGLGTRSRLRLAENQQCNQCRCQECCIRLNLVRIRCSCGFRTRGKLRGTDTKSSMCSGATTAPATEVASVSSFCASAAAVASNPEVR